MLKYTQWTLRPRFIIRLLVAKYPVTCWINQLAIDNGNAIRLSLLVRCLKCADVVYNIDENIRK